MAAVTGVQAPVTARAVAARIVRGAPVREALRELPRELRRLALEHVRDTRCRLDFEARRLAAIREGAKRREALAALAKVLPKDVVQMIRSRAVALIEARKSAAAAGSAGLRAALGGRDG